jgi:hypothetical protein
MTISVWAYRECQNTLKMSVNSHLAMYVNRISFLGCVPSMLSHEEGYHLKGIPYQPTNISNTNQSACPLELQDTHIKMCYPQKE